MAKIHEDLVNSGKVEIKTKNGTCTVLKYKAAGGMAEVFEGKFNGRDCIVKTPKVSVEVNRNEFETQNKYLEREYTALEKLSHPDIVQLLGYGEYKGENYLIEEFLKGQTLEKYLDNPLPENEAKKIVLKVARIIEFTHKNGFLYRDLSPDNVMQAGKDIKLFDFGLAITGFKDSEEDSNVVNKRTMGGHLYFSSFEQLNEGLSTPAGDVYSSGTLLWFLLTGKWPTEWGNFSPAIDVDVSENLNEIVLIATSKDWKERYQTIGEFIYALENDEPHSGTLRGGVINIDGMNYPLRQTETIIGRTDDDSMADINVDDPEQYISRYAPQISTRHRGHCKIIRENGRYYLENLNNVNGTWILTEPKKKEWKRIGEQLDERIIINDGDIITFAFSEKKGHYKTFTFRDYGKG